jgi:hypothetical protein
MIDCSLFSLLVAVLGDPGSDRPLLLAAGRDGLLVDGVFVPILLRFCWGGVGNSGVNDF